MLGLKRRKMVNEMGKVEIKCEKMSGFGGIFDVREVFWGFVGGIIEKVLGMGCR